MKLIDTSVRKCPKCAFDMDEYDDKDVTVFVCCNCEHTIRYEYYCVVCGEWFEFDPNDEPHSTEDGEDCHAKCCPICNSKEEFYGGTLLHSERKERKP